MGLAEQACGVGRREPVGIACCTKPLEGTPRPCAPSQQQKGRSFNATITASPHLLLDLAEVQHLQLLAAPNHVQPVAGLQTNQKQRPGSASGCPGQRAGRHRMVAACSSQPLCGRACFHALCKLLRLCLHCMFTPAFPAPAW